MRQVLIDYARRYNASRRGSGARHVDLAEVEGAGAVAVEEKADTATALGVTERTVRRDWVKARAWLNIELGGVTQE